MSLALQSGFLTTGPPGRPSFLPFYLFIISVGMNYVWPIDIWWLFMKWALRRGSSYKGETTAYGIW